MAAAITIQIQTQIGRINNRTEILTMVTEIASLTLVSSKCIENNIHVTNFIIKLYGVARDTPIRTQGIVNGTFQVENQQLESALHIVEPKYAGPADGFFGFDVASSYNAIINIKELNIEFTLRNCSPDRAQLERFLKGPNADQMGQFRQFS